MFRKALYLGLAAVPLSSVAMAQARANSGEAQKHVFLQLSDNVEFGPIGITAAMAGPASTVAGAPYSAEAITRQVQTLADGNRIEHITSGSVARDSQGRLRRDEALPGFTSGSNDAPHLVMIHDPVAGIHWMLDAQKKTAIKMPLAQMRPDKATTLGIPPPGPEKTFFYTTTTTSPSSSLTIAKSTSQVGNAKENTTKTDLGMQTIEGVSAQGTRTTHTIPAGAVGNEQPIVITTETWYSPELKVLVMSKTNDPRMGETTYKLTNIVRAEPLASLFQVPDDYTISDQPANTFISRPDHN